jgi:adenylate cyclase
MPDAANTPPQSILATLAALARSLDARIDALEDAGLAETSAPAGLAAARQHLQAAASRRSAVASAMRALQQLPRTATTLNEVRPLPAVLNTVMDTVIALSGAERGAIVLRDESDGTLTFHAARDLLGQDLTQEMGISHTLLRAVIESGEPILTDNAGTDARFMGKESVVHHGLRSIMAVPLAARGRAIGAIICDNRFQAGVFHEEDLDVMRAFAQQAAIAIENARLFDAIQRQIAEVGAAHARLARTYQALSVAVIALDRQGRIQACNAAAEAALNRHVADLRGTSLAEALPHAPRALRTLVTEGLRAGADGPRPLTIAIEGLGMRTWSVQIVPMTAAADPAAGTTALLVIDDQTDTLRQESQVRSLRQYLPAALVEHLVAVGADDLPAQVCVVTHLMADIRHFTKFSEALPPEAVLRIANEYLALAGDAIIAAGGVIDHYHGDAVTAYWNTPLNPLADHARQAYAAARQILRAVAVLHLTLPEAQHLYFGITVVTGEALVGTAGDANFRQLVVMGAAPGAARDLQVHAGPGELVIGPQTLAALEPRPPVEVVAIPDGATAGYRVLAP